MGISMDRILEWKLIPRLMLLVLTLVYIRCIEWALAQGTDLTTQQAALIAVVSGSMSGAFAAWVGSETKK